MSNLQKNIKQTNNIGVLRSHFLYGLYKMSFERKLKLFCLLVKGGDNIGFEWFSKRGSALKCLDSWDNIYIVPWRNKLIRHFARTIRRQLGGSYIYHPIEWNSFIHQHEGIHPRLWVQFRFVRGKIQENVANCLIRKWLFWTSSWDIHQLQTVQKQPLLLSIVAEKIQNTE